MDPDLAFILAEAKRTLERYREARRAKDGFACSIARRALVRLRRDLDGIAAATDIVERIKAAIAKPRDRT